ncbi:hypothetical protein [Streptomyces sp. NPDC029004]
MRTVPDRGRHRSRVSESTANPAITSSSAIEEVGEHVPVLTG